MIKQLRCIHNKAVNPGMGVTCNLRIPHTLCKDCKTFQPKYPSYCCQKCGEPIGWIGRFVEFIYCGFIKHECKK